MRAHSLSWPFKRTHKLYKRQRFPYDSAQYVYIELNRNYSILMKRSLYVLKKKPKQWQTHTHIHFWLCFRPVELIMCFNVVGPFSVFSLIKWAVYSTFPNEQQTNIKLSISTVMKGYEKTKLFFNYSSFYTHNMLKCSEFSINTKHSMNYSSEEHLYASVWLNEYRNEWYSRNSAYIPRIQFSFNLLAVQIIDVNS